jgi:TMEM175 potassium channel family protein
MMDTMMPAPLLGKNRIEALSDGVFAIAMTLLVLELHVPGLPSNASNVEILPALLHMAPKFLAYAASFISLGIYWVGHHNMYHAIRRSDRVLLWLNILFFMVVSFLPFSTSVLNAFRQSQIAPVFFGTNVILIGWILFLQWAYASSQPEMIADHVSPEYRKLVFSRFLWIPIILTLTVLICFWSAEISMAVYVLLMPLYLIPAKFDRRVAQGPRRAADEPVAAQGAP